MKRFLLVIWPGFYVSSLQAMPSDAQKKDMRAKCRPIIAQLVKAELSDCPHGMDKMGETRQGLTALRCVLNHRNDARMNQACVKAAEVVWREVPSLLRPDVSPPPDK